jgi:hypothetical protein
MFYTALGFIYFQIFKLIELNIFMREIYVIYDKSI